MSVDNERGRFVCPECCGNVAGSTIFVSTDVSSTDPWSGVLQRIECAGCSTIIPAHIAERWKGISITEAKKQWLDVYKKSAQS